IGIYYLTSALDEDLESIVPGKDTPLRLFGSADVVSLAISEGELGLQDTIWFRRPATLEKGVTTGGRVIFNNAVEEALYEAMGDEFDAANHEWINTTMRKSEISDYVSRLVEVYGAGPGAPGPGRAKD